MAGIDRPRASRAARVGRARSASRVPWTSAGSRSSRPPPTPIQARTKVIDRSQPVVEARGSKLELTTTTRPTRARRRTGRGPNRRADRVSDASSAPRRFLDASTDDRRPTSSKTSTKPMVGNAAAPMVAATAATTRPSTVPGTRIMTTVQATTVRRLDRVAPTRWSTAPARRSSGSGAAARLTPSTMAKPTPKTGPAGSRPPSTTPMVATMTPVVQNALLNRSRRRAIRNETDPPSPVLTTSPPAELPIPGAAAGSRARRLVPFELLPHGPRSGRLAGWRSGRPTPPGPTRG